MKQPPAGKLQEPHAKAPSSITGFAQRCSGAFGLEDYWWKKILLHTIHPAYLYQHLNIGSAMNLAFGGTRISSTISRKIGEMHHGKITYQLRNSPFGAFVL